MMKWNYTNFIQSFEFRETLRLIAYSLHFNEINGFLFVDFALLPTAEPAWPH